MATQLRDWQEKAIYRALKWLIADKKDRHFLINAAPGAGKTIAACELARRLIDMGEVDRVIVIAPRREVVRQWAGDFQRVTGRYMSKVTGSNDDINGLDLDVCATWAAIQGLLEAFQAVCKSGKVLVICDEHHHAAVEAAWGGGATSAFADAKYVLILTGTPIRSDGEDTAWLAYDDNGKIDHPEEGTYTLTYGEAVDLGYCRPVTFHRHDGRFKVQADGGEFKVSGSSVTPDFSGDISSLPALRKALTFYRLACTPQFDPNDEGKPLPGSYQWSMVQWAKKKLDEIRIEMPDAGGLIIAQNIQMAKYMAAILLEIEGVKPALVHSEKSNADEQIKDFKNSNKKWIVSVSMVSEGVDIPRLRVLVYLPNSQTELSFRQAIGRVVRSTADNDMTRAYVVMPSWHIFENYARSIESEMPAYLRRKANLEQNKLAKNFRQDLINCPDCGGLNFSNSMPCSMCNLNLQEFKVTLDEAIRSGVIARGMDIDIDELLEADRMASSVKKMILSSGDDALVKFFKLMPEEVYGHLSSIIKEAQKKKE
jgi:superfamily II DNA or RNA helicase